MYYVFEAEIAGQNDLIYAEAMGKMPNFLSIAREWSWWSDFPLPFPFQRALFRLTKAFIKTRIRQVPSLTYILKN